MLSTTEKMSKMKLEKQHADFANQRPPMALKRAVSVESWGQKTGVSSRERVRGEKSESARMMTQEILL